MEKVRCVLLVDDDETTNFYNEFQLKEADVADNVFVALNGQEAMDFLNLEGKFAGSREEYPIPNLILLDVNMPVMNGFEFLEAYQASPFHKQETIIISMLTTSFHKTDVSQAKSFELVKDYLNKPLEIPELVSMIKKHIG